MLRHTIKNLQSGDGGDPCNPVPRVVGAGEAADGDAVVSVGLRVKRDDLVAVVPRGRDSSYGAAARVHQQVEVECQRGGRGRVADRRRRRRCYHAVPRERDLHRAHLRAAEVWRAHVVPEGGKQGVASKVGRGQRPDVPAARHAHVVAALGRLRREAGRVAVERARAVGAIVPPAHVDEPRAARYVAAGAGQQDSAAALGPGAQHAVDTLDQRGGAGHGRRSEARAGHALVVGRDGGPVGSDLGQLAVAVRRGRVLEVRVGRHEGSRIIVAARVD